MSTETHVTLALSSASLYEALLAHLDGWTLEAHRFDPEVDELRVSYDVMGSGRVALTLGFELDRTQMAELLRRASPVASEQEASS